MIFTAALFGSKHLMGLGITVLFLITMFLISEKLLKGKKRTMIYILTGLFYVLEIAKISYIWTNNGAFPMNHLPFHLCSLPLYLMPLLAFIKNEKALSYIKPALVAGLLFGGIIALLYPVNILGDGVSFFPFSENVLEWISFMYHPLMLFSAFYVIYTGIYKISFEKFYMGFPGIIVFMLLAMIVNRIFDKDFMLLNTGNGSPFQFMIEEFGKLPYMLVMILLGLFGMFLFHSFASLLVSPKKVEERVLQHKEVG